MLSSIVQLPNSSWMLVHSGISHRPAIGYIALHPIGQPQEHLGRFRNSVSAVKTNTSWSWYTLIHIDLCCMKHLGHTTGPNLKSRPPSNLPIWEVDLRSQRNDCIIITYMASTHFQGPDHEGNENQRAKSYKDDKKNTKTDQWTYTHNEG